MICPKCKKEIKKDSKFCCYCGKKITGNVEVPNNSTEKKIIVSKSVDKKTNSKDLYISPEASREIDRRVNTTNLLNQYSPQTTKKKDASVIGRGVAGALIAGPAGAIVGALSAVDKNNKKKK